MANIAFYHTNLLTTATLKNGTSGAPPLNQDNDMPMSNLLLHDRNSVYKTNGDGTVVDIDFDLGTSIAVTDVFMLAYRHNGDDPGVGDPIGCDVYYSAGSSYPPTWTLLISTNNAGLNDRRFSTSGATGRFWRFSVPQPTAPQAPQFKFWLGSASGKITMTHDWGHESAQDIARLKLDTRTSSGLFYTYDVGELNASEVRGADLILSGASQAEWDALRSLASLGSRVITSEPSSALIWETTLNDGLISARKRFGWGGTGTYDIELRLEQHP